MRRIWRASAVCLRALGAVLLFTLLPACGTGGSGLVEISFQTLDQGLSTDYRVTSPEPGEVLLIRSQAELDAFWALHEDWGSGVAPVPTVDFTVDSVVAVLSTPKPTLGYQVTLEKVVMSGGLMSRGILLLTISQVTWGSPLTLVGRPFHIVAVNTAAARVVVVQEWKY